jgi:hypothetical protein
VAGFEPARKNYLSDITGILKRPFGNLCYGIVLALLHTNIILRAI